MNEIVRRHDHPNAPAAGSGISVIDFTSLRRGSLIGFATIHLAKWRVRLHGVAIHQRGDSRCAQLPARPMLDASGNTVRGDDGRPRYAPTIEFDNKLIGQAFSELVCAALEAYAPGCFDDVEAGA
jgi:hypothetical protein